MFVGHTEVRERKIKGKFKKFTYTQNDHNCFVYCESANDFEKLFYSWVQQASSPSYEGKYEYKIVDGKGLEIALKDIPTDENQDFKYIKNYVQCFYTGVWYIS